MSLIVNVCDRSTGWFRVTSGELLHMFVDPEESFQPSAESCEVPGVFCRQGRYLNIPGQNHLGDGDPNVSILVTDELRDAARWVVKIREGWRMLSGY